MSDIDPSAIELPPTEPVDMTALIIDLLRQDLARSE